VNFRAPAERPSVEKTGGIMRAEGNSCPPLPSLACGADDGQNGLPQIWRVQRPRCGDGGGALKNGLEHKQQTVLPTAGGDLIYFKRSESLPFLFTDNSRGLATAMPYHIVVYAACPRQRTEEIDGILTARSAFR